MLTYGYVLTNVSQKFMIVFMSIGVKIKRMEESFQSKQLRIAVNNKGFIISVSSAPSLTLCSINPDHITRPLVSLMIRVSLSTFKNLRCTYSSLLIIKYYNRLLYS